MFISVRGGGGVWREMGDEDAQGVVMCWWVLSLGLSSTIAILGREEGRDIQTLESRNR